MKRTFIIILTALVAALSAVSCNSLEPEYADSRYLKGWIFRNCIDRDCRVSLVEDFTEYDFSVPPQNLEAACDCVLRQLASLGSFVTWNIMDLDNPDAFCGTSDDFRKGLLNMIFFPESAQEILRQNPDATNAMLTEKADSFLAYVEDVADKEVHMLNWQLNEDAVADTYTGYLVEYEIGSGFYVLLDLTEYDKEERYTCEIVYSGDSLTELHQCYE